MVHDFSTGQDQIIPTLQGEIGRFSPDGRWLFYPKVIKLGNNHYVTHVVLVDVWRTPFVRHDLLPDTDANDDVEAAWQPNSKGLIVVRRIPEAPAMSAPQLYGVTLATGSVTPLVVDLNYTNGNLVFDPTGEVLLFQRVLQANISARPELWTYNLKTHQLERIAHNASFARWLP